ncbi:methyltransferase [Providencia rettgeri]|uniref:tRNA1(Val) (adenine(37)-N6)-methyltransferase n=1 Tax=Providencia rettgeri TaxID=587 RepID=A0AAE2ZB61_PRORE|nr:MULTISPECIES: methyltransferase [Providencia]MRF67792.1 methyltransferase [Escherichia coli]MBG5892162.1 methyltransferase [Providencia rettgeri]MBQ0528587.1 methyltransferase [Providencia rettgeri]MBW3116479.1 methyltransferase [Providencia rettgeri]MCK9787931.1 methyltransferase [Providencia rettgeri]
MCKQKKNYRKGGFTFKQFFVAHDRCAMKVGTDGVLLGAWAPADGVQSVLDIGSGSGLIALMLAQRNAMLCVDAVELDSDAAVQAQENFIESPWADRLHVINQDIVSYSQLSSVQYDLIVSNPPYFEPAVACRDEKRDQARYTATLTHDVLLESAKSCLTSHGLFCLVLPYEVGEKIQKMAENSGWFTAFRVNVSDKPTTVYHRMLLGIQLQEIQTQVTSLALKDEKGEYTDEFRKLIQPFYVKY